jgi:L,D-transpeptidase YcbB
MNFSRLPILFYLALTAVFLASCSNSGNQSAEGNPISNLFAKDICDANQIFNSTKTAANNEFLVLFGNDTLRQKEDLKWMYDNAEECYWVTNTGVTKNAVSLMRSIKNLSLDGLETTAFNISALDSLQKNFASLSAKDQNFYELAMSSMTIKACKAMLHGQFNPQQFQEDWFMSKDSNISIGKQIVECCKSGTIDTVFSLLEPKQKEYSLLKTKLAELSKINETQKFPKIQPFVDSITIGTQHPEIISLRKRLNMELGTPKDIQSNTADAELVDALKKFQYMHDLRINGKLDTSTIKKLNITIEEKIGIVKNNLERLRWMKNNPSFPNVWVNIPKMDLEYRIKDSIPFKMRVVVGRTSRPTPTLDAPMTNIVFNPGWNVPPTIMTEEIIPGVRRRGNGYLARRGLKAFYRGKPVDASRINAKNYKAFSIQQKPGLNSSLGVVKFNLPNEHAIYLHDTPHREDFVKYYRAYSSGCVRVEKPRDFAEFLLNDTLFTRAKIDSIAKSRNTKQINLKQQLPVYIVYLTASVDSANTVIYPRDIYNKDKDMSGIWK